MSDKVADMSRASFSIAYNGSGRGDVHSIDVETLSPALLAFGKLVREANTEANGKKSKSKVLVVSDFEHKCFNVNFEIVLTYWEQVQSLISTTSAKEAKEILEWLDLLKGPAYGAGGILGFLGFLKWRRGRKISHQSEITDADQSGVVKVTVEGENNPIQIHNHTWNLSQNPRALAAARDALSPVGTDGFDRLEVRDGDQVVNEILKDEVDSILVSCNAGIEESKNLTPTLETTTAWLTVYSPVYEATADRWRFKLGNDTIYADISETTIAEEALQRGGALVEDSYQVRLEIEVGKTPDGNDKKPTYKVLEVLRFVPGVPSVQGTLGGLEPDSDDG